MAVYRYYAGMGEIPVVRLQDNGRGFKTLMSAVQLGMDNNGNVYASLRACVQHKVKSPLHGNLIWVDTIIEGQKMIASGMTSIVSKEFKAVKGSLIDKFIRDLLRQFCIKYED